MNACEHANFLGHRASKYCPLSSFQDKGRPPGLSATNNHHSQILCVLKLSELATDLRFVDHSSRVQNQVELKEIFAPIICAKPPVFDGMKWDFRRRK
ncbi:unnamed protein product [Penicillium roqueforti FM164]|uniref:Uncharacterized protein n=1 Tax=Penicillium roqueforti (strain FM164) TaxID=1365484 RepID=W6QJQ4_PENRF|nr:unnamed protein product [Penicillium roqueforti FM164]